MILRINNDWRVLSSGLYCHIVHWNSMNLKVHKKEHKELQFYMLSTMKCIWCVQHSFVFSASVEQLLDWSYWSKRSPSWLGIDEHEQDSAHPELSASINRFRCSKCGKAYRHKPTLRRHTMYECGKEPQFRCPYCPYQTKRNSNLLRHIRSELLGRYKHA